MNGATKKFKKKFFKKHEKKKHRNKLKWKHNGSKPLGCSKSGPKREVYSNTGLLQKEGKISSKQLNIIPKGVKKNTNEA